MIVSFKNQGTHDIYLGNDTRAARSICPRLLWPTAHRKLVMINRATSVAELRQPPGNRLKRLQGDWFGLWSIRINDQYRACFRWDGAGPEDVEIVDYH